jgi:hypothetical protein
MSKSTNPNLSIDAVNPASAASEIVLGLYGAGTSSDIFLFSISMRALYHERFFKYNKEVRRLT